MSTECVTVKVEPKEMVDCVENDPAPKSECETSPEFINIKMEIEVPRLRIKSELVSDSPDEQETRQSWHQPVLDEGKTNNYVEVIIKKEMNESDHYDPSVQDDSLLQPTSSIKVDTNVEYTTTPCNRGFSCQICRKSFANPGNVQRHMLIHTKEKIKCTECPTEFSDKIKLEKHVFKKHTVTNVRAFPCDTCEKKFKSSSNLMQHRKVHLTVKPFTCPLCYKSFSFKSNLAKHQGKSRCKRPGEQIICHVCNKVFQKEFLLKSHLRRHDTERPFSCDQCSMKFKYKSTLIRHIQLHDGLRPFPCPYCEKSFTHSGLLKPHIRVHTGEKPYQCPICLKNFAHKHNMQRHKLRHDKIKHLVCDICHKTFPKESRLKYHMKTHVNEKYFACQDCPKRFSHKQNVLRHYSRKHPGKTYTGTDTDASVALKVWDSYKSRYYDDEAEVILG